MKSKEELKKLFENGDTPTQEDFWEWQDSYWHKDEKLPTEPAGNFVDKAYVDGELVNVDSTEARLNGSVKYERHNRYAYVTMNIRFSNLQVDETITIPVYDLFRNQYRLYRALVYSNLGVSVDVLIRANNSGIHLINRNNHPISCEIFETFVFECGIDDD